MARLDLRSWAQAYSGAEPVRAGTLDDFTRRFAPAKASTPAPSTRPTAWPRRRSLSPAAPAGPAAPALRRPRGLARGEARPGDGSRVSVGCGDRRLDGEALRGGPRACDAASRPTRSGEIWVRGPSVAQGYWGRPELSAQVFGAQLADGPLEAPPWLRTGDRGFLEPDGASCTCRAAKDLIILRGRNLYPDDIEAAPVEAASPAPRPGCVVALGLEEEGGVAVVAEHLRDPSAAEDPALIEALQAAVMQAVDAPLRAAVFLKAGGLPKTSSGKRQRHATAELLQARRAPGGHGALPLAGGGPGPGPERGGRRGRGPCATG
ncbi:MAG: AMP-binding protein [Alphaproteobacteria bacterium]|nr:AMP-binding protein [Alphaproteobacteria bacterium]